MKDIKHIIKKIKKLPPMPEVIGKILRIADDSSVSAKEIIDIIQYDQNIMANVLRLCNSSYYGLSRKVSSLNEAVVMLGNQTLYNMIIASISSSFLGKKNRGYLLEKGKLWEHSVSSAILAKEIAKKTGFKDKHLAYSAALLHDTGKVILDRFMFEEYNNVLKKVTDQETSFNKIEDELIGINHAEVGAILAENWDFPVGIIDAIRYHHTPEEATANVEIVFIVHLADALSIMFGFSSGIDGLAYHFSDKVLETLKIKEDEIYALSPFLINEIKNAKEMLEL